MIKLQKLKDTKYPTYEIRIGSCPEMMDKIGVVEHRTYRGKSLAWALIVGGKGAKTHYFDTLREIKDRIAFVAMAAILQMQEHKAPEQKNEAKSTALGEAERFVRQQAEAQEGKVRARWLALADHFAELAR